MTDQEYRDKAHALYAVDGEIESDDNAEVSESEYGAYVQAWVWVPKSDAKERAAEFNLERKLEQERRRQLPKEGA